MVEEKNLKNMNPKDSHSRWQIKRTPNVFLSHDFKTKYITP